jgi:protein AaeX
MIEDPMIEELNFFGVYLPAALFWAVLATVVTFLLRGLLRRLSLHRILWHPALLELALFVSIWLGLARLADSFLPRGLIS